MTPIAGPLLRSVTGILVFCFFIPVLPACQDTLSCANLNKKTRNALDSFDLETAYYWMAKALNACAPPHYKAKKRIPSSYLSCWGVLLLYGEPRFCRLLV